ncbi:hypothetical protein [Leuconostoc citreum]|uniref:hypothetical protein n=1 Tax=Leuconostoc citreum TaxID=33964 RepID=UPI0025A013F3|nr:hypothetical protein [Leuconostoc citreum]MDM7641110.1 hypothetical protein [Leuconostoc citreum]
MSFKNSFVRSLNAVRSNNSLINSKMVRNINVMMDIVDPILLSYEDNEGVHALYLIKHKRIKKQYTFLRFQSNYEQLELVFDKIIPISALFPNNMEKIDIDLKRSKNTSYPINLSKAKADNYLPQDTFYLDKKYPNNINLNIAKLKVKQLKKNFNVKSELFENVSLEFETSDKSGYYTISNEQNNKLELIYENNNFKTNFSLVNKQEKVFEEKNENKLNTI